MDTPLNPSSHVRVRFGSFELTPKTRELRGKNKAITLQEQPCQLLLLLLEHTDELATREQIQEKLWPNLKRIDFERGINVAVKNLRKALKDVGDSPDESEYVQTITGRGYKISIEPEWIDSAAPERFHGMTGPGGKNGTFGNATGLLPADRRAAENGLSSAVAAQGRKFWGIAILIMLVVLAGSGLYYRSHHNKLLTDKDTIVLSDFSNSTGDAVFDGALRQGLSAQLEQSPFLRLLSDERITQTLALMSQPKDVPFTPDLAREVCQRTQSAATIEGSIVKLDSQYVLGLKAVGCRDGEPLANEQEVAPDREHVLSALDRAATDLRTRLGESLSSVQKYDVPLESVTTTSLEALKAYSLGNRALNSEDYPTAISLGKRASDLDPNFAMAYMLQGASYAGLSENEHAVESMRTAYGLRYRVSQREKFLIESFYVGNVSGNLAAAQKEYALWAELYPRDSTPSNQLGYISLAMGDYDEAVAEFTKSAELEPGTALGYVNIANTYLFLNRPSEAEASIREAQAQHIDPVANHVILYVAAFLRHDAAGMDREKSSLMGKPGYEDQVLNFESDGAAYEGHLVKARELSERAADSAQHAEEKEVAASYIAESALRDALVGIFGPAKQEAEAAVARSNGSEVEAMAAIAFALAGDSAETERLSADLNKRFPQNTIVQFNYLPVIETAAALHGNPAKALQVISPAEQYELGFIGNGADFNGYPVYFRGEAFLANHQGTLAAAEFRKILDHPGVVVNEPIGALAYLGLGRAYALSGDTAKAKAEYQEFLSLWKDADPDIPIYKQAKTEYAVFKSL